MNPEQIVLFGVAAMPLIFGIVQVIKTAGMPSRFAGLLAILLGTVIGLLAALTTETQIGAGIAQGLLAGLGASGAWSVGTQVTNGAFTETQQRKRKRPGR